MEKEAFLKRWCIALTGNIATGKSFVSSFLKEKGFLVFDADKLSREVSRPKEKAYKEIIEVFGSGLLDSSGLIDRSLLSKIIFEDKNKRETLESIIHPEIENRLFESLKEKGIFEKPQVFFYDAALIFEKKKEKKFKEVWLTHCEKKTQRERLKLRNRAYSASFIEHLISSQETSQTKKNRADFLIDTEETKKKVEERVEEKIKGYHP